MKGHFVTLTKDLTGINYSSVTSNNLTIDTANIGIMLNAFGAVDELSDGSGTRKFSYLKGHTENVTYLTGALNGYKLERTFDNQGRQTTLTLKSGGTAVHDFSLNYLGGSRQVASVSPCHHFR